MSNYNKRQASKGNEKKLPFSWMSHDLPMTNIILNYKNKSNIVKHSENLLSVVALTVRATTSIIESPSDGVVLRLVSEKNTVIKANAHRSYRELGSSLGSAIV